MGDPKTLYEVEFPWNNLDPEQGTYCTTVWAADEDEAARVVADEMAEHNHSGCETHEQRSEFASGLMAGDRRVTQVEPAVASGLEELLSDQLFPDGVRRSLNMGAVADVLVGHRERIVNGPGRIRILSPEELERAYVVEYPAYTKADWRSAVADGETTSGYWRWVHERLDEEASG